VVTPCGFKSHLPHEKGNKQVDDLLISFFVRKRPRTSCAPSSAEKIICDENSILFAWQESSQETLFEEDLKFMELLLTKNKI